MADNDLVDTGVLVREGVLEDSLVVLGLRRDIEEEKVRGRGGWESERKGMGREGGGAQTRRHRTEGAGGGQGEGR